MRSIPFILALVVLTGCLIVPAPHTTVRDYKISGTILDARTHAPIPHAVVYRTKHPKYATYTDSSGHFVLKEIRNWHYARAGEVHLPAQEYWGDGHFTVSRTNYAERTIDLFSEHGPAFFLDKPDETTEQRHVSLAFNGGGAVLMDAGAAQYLKPGDILVVARLQNNVEDRPSKLHIGFARPVLNPRVTGADQPDKPSFSPVAQKHLDWEFGITYGHVTDGAFLQDTSRVYRLEFIPQHDG